MKFLSICIFLIVFQIGNAQTSIPASAEQVKTGIHLMNIYDLDINKHSFYADFYIWFKWKGTRDPINIEFVNIVEKWGSTRRQFYNEPKLLPDGHFYNGMRIEGRFSHPFELSRFPLDQHQLNIHIENVQYPLDSLVYLPDANSVFVRNNFWLPGWDILSFETENHSNLYPTNMGETIGTSVSFSNFTFKVSIARPINYFLLKLLLPLFIAIFISLGALRIYPNRTDARISVVIGSLLTAVFLQQSYSSALPDVGYMVLMDKIYLLVYIMISLIMLRIVLVGNQLERLKDATDLEVIRQRDKKLTIYYLIALLVGMFLVVYLF